MSTAGKALASVRDFARAVYAGFLRCCDEILPKSERIVIATIPDGDDQGVALCRELIARGWAGRVDWLVGDFEITKGDWTHRRGIGRLNLRFVRRYSLRGLWTFLTARWVFYTHGIYFSYPPPDGKVVINLWHGMPVKRIWRGVPGASLAPQSSLLLSTSPLFTEVLMKASGFGIDKILESGLPRNDLLANPTSEAVATAARLRGSGDRLILFLPTYRQSKMGFITHDGQETGSILGLGPRDAMLLHTWLEENNCKLLVKPHPMSIHAGAAFPDDDFWCVIDERRLADEGIGLYELLSQADLLITDISSIYVDFLKTGKPQIFYFPDKEKYLKTRGMLLEPLEDFVPGPIAVDYAQMETALTEWIDGRDSSREQRQRLRDLMIPEQKLSASQIVLEAAGVFTVGSAERGAKPPVMALVWAQYGPYHFARINKLRSTVSCIEVLGVEIGSRSATYGWARAAVPGTLHTLCPGKNAESVPAIEIYFKALEYFRRHRVGAVFCPSYWPASSLAIILAARRAGAKIIMMNDSHALTAKATGIWAKIKRRLVLQFDAALVAGTPQKEYFASMGLNAEKIVLGYDAVDNGHFAERTRETRIQAERIRAKHGLPERYFLNVGRMVWKKNLETLVDAHVQTKRRLGTACPALVFVGSGPLENALRKRAHKSGLVINEHGAGLADVYFLGFRQVDELPEFYALAECFVLPSREEEWGLVVNEAMASGLPVLVSKVAGCARDLVHHGENGFLFDPFDSTALSTHLESIARDNVAAKRMGKESERIIADWGCDRFAAAAQEALDIALRD